MVDINNEEAIKQPIEEVREEVVNEVVEEPVQETDKVIEEVKEQPKEETTKVKAQDANPCVKAQDRMVRCEKCNKEMKYKDYRYGQQQRCQGGIENKPVKTHTKVRAKPKIQQVEVYEQAPKQVIKQQVPQQQSQPSNPLTDKTNLDALLQNQYIQQKKQKYYKLCQNVRPKI